ncbi:hypothetical protein TRFO_36113 [Tritrichomonas foetus]|uniref:Uncharacterized protein n=1 Tax=Tritrichomonas foetus TaxID=1144522 RepID=A0A1J4JJB6_9EUKA|nr:hypothetical protein TRFO_36113 [Tritrichomonas foetus]|eukprot:OHS97661.1 hypothetical protein TRFO_36113 [Tritrichomonas foetus]
MEYYDHIYTQNSFQYCKVANLSRHLLNLMEANDGDIFAATELMSPVLFTPEQKNEPNENKSKPNIANEENDKKVFGIMDLKPNMVNKPPVFTEEATLEAMRKLKILPEDLVPQDAKNEIEITEGLKNPTTHMESEINHYSENSSMRFQISIELERRRFETISKIIEERNKIISGGKNSEKIEKIVNDQIKKLTSKNQSHTENEKSDKTKKGLNVKRKVSKRISKQNSKSKKFKIKTNHSKSGIHVKNIPMSENRKVENDRNKIPRRKRKNFISKFKTQSNSSQISSQNSIIISSIPQNKSVTAQNSIPKIPKIKNLKTKTKIVNGLKKNLASTNRRKAKINSGRFSDQKRKKIADIKKKQDDEQRAKAEKALERVKKVEERQKQMQEEKAAYVKQKAELRMKRLKNGESKFNQIRNGKKHEFELELQREERNYMQLQERKKKQFENEQKIRQEKIYKNVNFSRISAQRSLSKMRQKIIAKQQETNNQNQSQNQNQFFNNNKGSTNNYSVNGNSASNAVSLMDSCSESSQETESLPSGTEDSLFLIDSNVPMPPKSLHQNNLNEKSSETVKKLSTQEKIPRNPSSILNKKKSKPPIVKPNPRSLSMLQSTPPTRIQSLVKIAPCNSLVKMKMKKPLPVIGNNRTKIPCLRP